MFKDKVVVVTGGAKGIGKAISEAFIKSEAKVCIVDKINNDYFIGDIACKEMLESFAEKVSNQYGSIDYLINNAMFMEGGIEDCSYENFNYALKVGVAAPFYLVKLFKDKFSEGGAIVNISSTRAFMSQYNTESYTAAKGGISALTHSLAISLAGKVRVNSVSPGWIDCSNSMLSKQDNLQHPVGRVGNPNDIANMVLYLCSDKASFITGQDFVVDGGMTKKMIYHNDYGWKLEK